MTTGEEALKIVDRMLEYQKQPVLKDLQCSILLLIWEKYSYRSIAQELDYETDYIKHVAAQLWKLLSKLIGEKVTKGNIESIVQQYRFAYQITDWGATILMPKNCVNDVVLMQLLREKRCLIILDQMESILQTAEYSARYLISDESYRQCSDRSPNQIRQSNIIMAGELCDKPKYPPTSMN